MRFWSWLASREVPSYHWLRVSYYLGNNDSVSEAWVDAYKRGLHGARQ